MCDECGFDTDLTMRNINSGIYRRNVKCFGKIAMFGAYDDFLRVYIETLAW